MKCQEPVLSDHKIAVTLTKLLIEMNHQRENDTGRLRVAGKIYPLSRSFEMKPLAELNHGDTRTEHRERQRKNTQLSLRDVQIFVKNNKVFCFGSPFFDRPTSTAD